MKKGFMSFFKRNKNKRNQDNLDNSRQQIIPGYQGEEKKEENPQKYIHTDAVGGRNREMILSYLKIKDDKMNNENDLLNKLITSEDVDNVEFSISTPTGLDSEEVSNFCDKVELNIKKYREYILALKQDKEKLINEVLRIENKAEEERQQSLIGQQFNDNQSATDELKETIIKLQQDKKILINKVRELQNQPNVKNIQLENTKLNEEIANLKSKLSDDNQQVSEIATKQIQALSAENKQLKTQLQTYMNNDESGQSSDNSDEIANLQAQLKDATDEITILKNNAPKDLSGEVESYKKQLDETNKKLTEALEIRQSAESENDENSKQVQLLTSQLQDAKDKNVKLVEELKSKSSGISLEAIQEKDKKIKALQLENAKIKDDLSLAENEVKNKSINFAENPDEYEKVVMHNFSHKQLKHIKKRLSLADIKKMQEGEKKANLALGTPVKKENDNNTEDKPDSNNETDKPDINKDGSKNPFDNLFKEMNNNDD